MGTLGFEVFIQLIKLNNLSIDSFLKRYDYVPIRFYYNNPHHRHNLTLQYTKDRLLRNIIGTFGVKRL